MASLNNHVLDDYVIQTEGAVAAGREVAELTSDAGIYGGNSVGNYGEDLPAGNGRIQLRIPANAFVILEKRSWIATGPPTARTPPWLERRPTSRPATWSLRREGPSHAPA